MVFNFRVFFFFFVRNISHSCVIIFILINLQMTQFTNDSSSSSSSSDVTGIEVLNDESIGIK